MSTCACTFAVCTPAHTQNIDACIYAIYTPTLTQIKAQKREFCFEKTLRKEHMPVYIQTHIHHVYTYIYITNLGAKTRIAVGENSERRRAANIRVAISG